MADNIATTPGSGATIAADDVGGVLYQRVKIGVGADGAAVDMAPPDADGKAATSILPAGVMVRTAAGTWNRLQDVDARGDGSGAGAAAVGVQIFNGATYDRQRGEGSYGDGMAGTGVAATALRLFNGTTYDRQRGGTIDGQGATGYAAGVPHVFNGATYDRQRGNTEGTLLASAARTTQTISANQTNYNARGVAITLNVTVDPGGARTLTVVLQAIDPVSGSAPELATFAAVTAPIAATFIAYPGAAETTAMTWVQVQAVPVPRSWRAVVTPSDGASWTYSLGYSYIL